MLLESLLGLRLENGKLHFAPCVPPDWPGFELSYRYRATLYRIDIVQMAEGAMVGASRLWLDGIEQTEPAISLVDDIREHQVRLSFQPALPLVQGYH